MAFKDDTKGIRDPKNTKGSAKNENVDKVMTKKALGKKKMVKGQFDNNDKKTTGSGFGKTTRKS